MTEFPGRSCRIGTFAILSLLATAGCGALPEVRPLAFFSSHSRSEPPVASSAAELPLPTAPPAAPALAAFQRPIAGPLRREADGCGSKFG